MSSSTYYSFLGSVTNKSPVGTTAAHNNLEAVAHSSDSIDSNRQTATSPESFATSPTNSNSSLNRFHSSTPTSNVSSLVAFSSSSSASTNSMTTTSATAQKPSPASIVSTKVAPRELTTTSTNNNNIVSVNEKNNFSDKNNFSTNYEQEQNRHNNHLHQRDLLRKLSATPTSMQPFHQIPQLTHSYTLHSLEPRPLKPFKSRDAYIDAMKEDLSEWLNRVYPDLELSPDDFFSQLETGSIICRHANNVTQMGRNLMLEQAANDNNSNSSENSFFQNEQDLNEHSRCPIESQCIEQQFPTTKQQIVLSDEHASQNMSQNSLLPTSDSSISSIATCGNSTTSSRQRSSLTGISKSLSPRFNDNRMIDWFRVKMIPYKANVRAGTFFARDNICQFIGWCRTLNVRECLLFETDDLVARKNEKSFILCLLEVARIGFKVGMPTPLIIQLEQEIDLEIENDAKLEQGGNAAKLASDQYDSVSSEEIYDTFNNRLIIASNDGNNNGLSEDNKFVDVPEGEQSNSLYCETNEQKQETIEDCLLDYGPKPQVITNDLLSLHERVVQLLCQCTCPTQFPMVRIGDGKYRVGDKLVIFVRILRRHIMVRVGGGWQELSEFLRQKDPCRTNKHHHNFLGSSPTYEHVATTLCSSMTPMTTTTTSPPVVNGNRETPPTTKIPFLTNRPNSTRSRLLGSNNYLNRNHLNNRSGQKTISGSLSMSWLANNQ